MTPPLPSPLVDLIAKWREREQRLCRQADGQGSTQYAERLAAKADGIAQCADELEALIKEQAKADESGS